MRNYIRICGLIVSFVLCMASFLSMAQEPTEAEQTINLSPKEGPNSAIAVRKMLTAVILPGPNFLTILSLKKLEMIVPTDMMMEIMPA